MTARLDTTDTFMRALGFEAYRVGGSVRDEILGRKVKDADYMVRGVGLNDLWDAVKDAGAPASWLTLRDGATVGVRTRVGRDEVEIVLPRMENVEGGGHRDIVVDPCLSLAEDCIRRDFTFNALYLPVADETNDLPVRHRVSDPTGRGLYDLLRRKINVTHADSFRDDPLRALRALRFISTLDYDLGAETRALMALHADTVTGRTAAGTSGTVLEELEKLLMGQNPAKALRAARDTGVLAAAWPELAAMLGFDQGSRYHDLTTDEHTFTALETAAHVDAPLRVRMALLFHDAGKPEAAWVGKDGRKHYYANPDGSTEDHEIVGERIWRAAANRMNSPNEIKAEVAALIVNHMVPCMKVNPVKVRRERVRLGDDLLRDLYLMRMCDLTGKGKANVKHLEVVAGLEKVRCEAEDAGVPVGLGDLDINGRDVLEYTKDSREIGRVLRAVLDEVVVDPDEQKRTREWQVQAAARLAR